MTPPGTLSPALGQPDHSSFLRPPSSPRSPLAAQKHASAPSSPLSELHSAARLGTNDAATFSLAMLMASFLARTSVRHPHALPGIRAAARHSPSRKQVILMS